MSQNETSSKSKYLKPPKEHQIFRKASILFLFNLFVMPQYFGIPNPVFDLTVLRIMLILVTFLIILDPIRRKDFAHLCFHTKTTVIFLPYLFVCAYTMALRADLKTFLNPFLEIFGLFLTIYIIKNELGVERTINIILGYLYFMTILGIIEYVIGVSPFSYLETISGTYSGAFIRSGHYRIMSSCVHSLGYGLLLIVIFPIACFNEKEKIINLFQRPGLLALVLINVFLTGSRSTLGIFGVECFVLLLLSSKLNKKKAALAVSAIGVCLAAFLLIFRGTSAANYIMLQITSMIDTVLDTEYAAAYGANMADLGASTNYRENLKLVYKLDWLNPLIGLGRKRASWFSAEINGTFIKSVDDEYIAEYLFYAYPGLVTFIFYIFYFCISMLRTGIKKCENSSISLLLLVGSACYALNLKWVATLQTMKYLYILFALYVCLVGQGKKQDNILLKPNSQYIKKRKIYWL